jgi:phosphoglycerate dehydrogenase-like enzyme
MQKILIAPMTLASQEGEYQKALRQAGFELAYPPRATQLTEDELLRAIQGVKGALAGSEPYTRRILESNRDLRVIARAGVGYDAVDIVAATERGVAVCITPGTNHDCVAEHTFGLILALAKELIPQHLAVKSGKWPRQPNLPLRGLTLGIAGLGRIGKAVALRGESFGMKLLAHEPLADEAFVARHQITLMTFDQLLSESDYLTLHIPLSAETRHLINRRTLGLMKATAFLINTARGGLINEKDIFESLKERKIAGAALDVFEQEPPPADHPFFQLDNVVLTPHAAGVDLKSRDDMAMSAAQAIISLSRGEWPAEKVVNPEVKKIFRW